MEDKIYIIRYYSSYSDDSKYNEEILSYCFKTKETAIEELNKIFDDYMADLEATFESEWNWNEDNTGFKVHDVDNFITYSYYITKLDIEN